METIQRVSRHHRQGWAEFPFRSISKNEWLWFPLPNYGNEFFHSLPIPEFREWVFFLPTSSRTSGMELSIPFPELPNVIPAHPYDPKCYVAYHKLNTSLNKTPPPPLCCTRGKCNVLISKLPLPPPLQTWLVPPCQNCLDAKSLYIWKFEIRWPGKGWVGSSFSAFSDNERVPRAQFTA